MSTVPSGKYTERQESLGRPVSPHVTTYAFPTVAISSITQRVTGVALTVGVGGIAASALVGADVAVLAASIACTPIKFGVAFPLVYHYFGGVRHVLWDRNPAMLQNKEAEQSAYLLMGGSTVVSAGLALLSF